MKKHLIVLAATLSTLVLLSTVALASNATTASTATTAPTSTTAPTAKAETYTVTNDGVNVRSGPGTSYSKLGMLIKGAKETGVITDGWFEFTYNGKSAYCSAKYLSKDSDAVAVTAPTEKTVTYQVSATELNVRSGPGTTYSSLGKLTKGTKETGVEINGWLKFTYNNVTAYCSLKYLSPDISTDKKS